MKNEQVRRGIIYTRVSTDDQAENGYSLDHQEKISKAYCIMKEISMMQLFQEDYSAKNFDRPKWNQLVEFLKKNKKSIDCLVFTKWDRFSRNAEEAWKVIKMLQSFGIEIICIEQPLDLSVSESKLMLAIYLIVPEMENDKISSRTKDGMREAQLQGFWMGKAPLGYNNMRDANKKSTLEISEKSELVRESFEMMATGLYACEEVRREIMTKWKIKTSKQAFVNMLRNIAYAGKIVIKEWKKVDEQVVQGNHKPIISMELYYQVQDVLSGRKKQPKFHIKKSDFLPLRGHLICPECNGNLTGSGSTGRGGKKHYYYHCQKGCDVRFRADNADKKFLEYLVKIKISEPVKNMYGAVMRDIYKEKQGDKSKKVEQLISEIAKNIKRKESAQDMLADGKMAREDFNDIKKRVEDEVWRLETELLELKLMDANFMKYMNFTLQLIEKIDYFYEVSPVEIKQKILVSMFPEKLVFDTKKYRTTKMNEVISVITRKDNGLKGSKMTMPTKIGGQSIMAPYHIELSNSILENLLLFQEFIKKVDSSLLKSKVKKAIKIANPIDTA